MENGAKGCEVIVSGKLRAQRAKSMKFRDGYMIKSGEPVNEYVDFATRHIQLKQGVLGVKVKIMLPYAPEKGAPGAKTRQPDVIDVYTPKETEVLATGPKQGYAQHAQPPAQQQQAPADVRDAGVARGGGEGVAPL